MKRRRPWGVSAYVIVSAVLAATEAAEVAVDPWETDVTPTPTIRPSQAPSIQPAVVKLVTQSYPVLFEIDVKTTDSADVGQIATAIDEVLENYFFLGLSIVEQDGLNVRQVDLEVEPENTRRLTLRLLETEAVFVVDGKVDYDMDANGCVECMDGEIDAELSNLLEMDKINQVVRQAQIPGISSENPVSTVSLLNKREVSSPTSAPTREPIVTVLKKSYPIQFEMDMNTTDTADYDQITEEVDEVLENYFNLGFNVLERDGLNIRGVNLDIDLKQETRLLIRRELQSDDITLLVDGDVGYDMTTDGCVECVEEEIENQLDFLTDSAKLDQVIQQAQIDGVNEVTDINPWSSQTGGTKSSGLERPSTLSIIFGFALTAIAALGLIGYAYIFFRKRRRRQRKERQQRESIQYPVASSRVSPAKRPQPPPPPPTATPANDDDSDNSSYKGLGSASEEAPADSFAQELQMAASLDQQAWDEFQMKKVALDRNEPIKANAAPQLTKLDTAAPPTEEPQARWAKSFPYGDEEAEEQGIEWSDDQDNGDYREQHRAAMHPEEKKEEHTGVDPEPSPSMETSAMLQSIERTLSQYGDNSENMEDTSMAPEEVVDEVARLSRYVQRYEKRKERRVKRESDRMNRSSDASTGQSPSEASADPAGVRGSFLTRGFFKSGNENNARFGNMPPQQAQQPIKPNEGEADEPRITSYTGIQMTGALYSQDVNREMLSISDSDDDDSHRDEDGSLRSQRLGITPFNVQNAHDIGYGGELMVPAMHEEHPSRQDHSNSLSPPNRFNPDRQRTQSDGEFYNSRAPKLSDLRTNEAIIDSSQSDVNVGRFSQSNEAGPTSNPRIPRLEQKTARTPTGGTPSSNPKFSKLRNLFEDKPTNAIFPPDENWQHGISKN